MQLVAPMQMHAAVDRLAADLTLSVSSVLRMLVAEALTARGLPVSDQLGWGPPPRGPVRADAAEAGPG